MIGSGFSHFCREREKEREKDKEDSEVRKRGVISTSRGVIRAVGF